MADYFKIAKLDEESVDQIRELEKETGKHIMAFTAGLSIADLSEAQLAKVQALEEELGVTLLVYES